MPLTASIRNVPDLINACLVRIGFPDDIGSLYEGSKAASLALDSFGEARDDIMRRLDPGFAQQQLALTLLKSAPASYVPGVSTWDPATYPQLPWQFEYAYPDSCLRLKSLNPVPILLPVMDPRPNPFAIANDNTLTVPPALSTKVILCNVPSAIATITARVTDVTVWDVDFVDAVIDRMGEILGPALVGMDAAKMEAAESQVSTAVAGMEQG